MREWIFTRKTAAEILAEILRCLPRLEDGKRYVISIKEHRAHRSLDANAYCWVLIGRLAAAIRQPPEEVYRELVRRVGGNYTVLPIQECALPRWKQIWSGKGLGWICEELGPSKLPGYINTVNYYGSSAFDSRQMSRLIDEVAGECREYGIETRTPEELDQLKEGWGQ